MSPIATIAFITISLIGMGWVAWIYVREAKRCYEADTRAQKEMLARQRGEKLPDERG
jgi:hypothetical protein